MASRNSASPGWPPATNPAARKATPSVRGAPKARANSTSSTLKWCAVSGSPTASAARADRPGPGGDLAGSPKIVECFTPAVLGEPKAAPGVAEYGRRLGRAKELCGQRLEGSLGSVEVAPFHQHVDQN